MLILHKQIKDKMKREHEIILLTILVNKTINEKKRIDELLEENIDWIEVSGILMNHRLTGYFINGLDNIQIKKIPRELRKSMQMLVLGQKEKQIYLNVYIKELYEALDVTDIRYAGLKGIILGTEVYKIGDRRSNDLDLLVYENDLDKLDKVIRKLGYIQSLMPNGEFVEASKKEKLIQRLNYHDLVPYMKESNFGFIEIDINFLFDGKENLIDEKVFEYGTMTYYGKEYNFRGLNYYTNLAFLLTHFYREATEEPWVKSKRNLTIYKLADIINYIRIYSSKISIDEFIDILQELNLFEKGLYSLYITREFSDNKFVNNCISLMEQRNIEVVSKLKENKEIYHQYYEEAFNLGR